MAHDACANVGRQCASFELLCVEIGALVCINLHEYLENDDPAGLWAANRPYVERIQAADRPYVAHTQAARHRTLQG